MSGKASVTYAHEFSPPKDQQIGHWKVQGRRNSRLPILQGRCPTCNHDCVVEIVDIVVQGSLPAGANETGPSVLSQLIVCNCLSDHQQPPGVRGGCGRYWLAELSREGDGSYRLSVQKNAHILSAATALNAAQQDQDKNIRNTAEKWLGLVSVIYGLFSLAGIAAAGNAVSGLTMISKIIVGAALALALFAAGCSLFTGYLAAYGWPAIVSIANDGDLEAWHNKSRNYSIEAVERLRKAIILALVSFGCLTAVTSLIWFLPRQPYS